MQLSCFLYGEQVIWNGIRENVRFMYIVLVASKTGTDMENKGKNDTLQATFYEYDRPFPKKKK